MTEDQNNRPVGGFFELDLPTGQPEIHADSIALSTGRSCLCAILRYLRPKRCLVPYYLCASAVRPFHKLGVEIECYEVTESMTPVQDPDLGPDDCLLYVNYFGLNRDEAERLHSIYGSRLIVDNTHDLFDEGGYENAWSFTSARKYFGIPDGAYLSVPRDVEVADVVPPETPPFTDISLQHSLTRLTGPQEVAFELFQDYESRMPCELFRISDYSRCILSHIEFSHVRATRRKNFEILWDATRELNTLKIELPDQFDPFACPFLPQRPVDRQRFFDLQIFVPVLWPRMPNCDASEFPVSVRLSQQILPLPIDHRYGPQEMHRIAEAVNRYAK